MTLRTCTILLLISAIFFSFTCVVKAEEQSLNDQQVKPAIVYNIARYVTWPPTPMNELSVFTIGIYGQGRNSAMWSSLNGKTVAGAKIAVVRSTDPDELMNCQIVFIELSEKRNAARILATLKEHPILTISEIEGFTQNGGMIALRIINNRMAFEINMKNARNSGLTISSKLLKLATEVIK